MATAATAAGHPIVFTETAGPEVATPGNEVITMISENDLLFELRIADLILDVVDATPEATRGDLQGCAQAAAKRIVREVTVRAVNDRTGAIAPNDRVPTTGTVREPDRPELTVCPRCGRSLADGVYGVRTGVAERTSLRLAAWGWETGWTEAECSGDAWFECGGCEQRLPDDCAAWIRARM